MIVVAGCGFIGSAFARAVTDSGQPVVALARGEPGAGRQDCGDRRSNMACDLGDGESVRAVADRLAGAGETPRVILHCASSGRTGAEGYRHVFVGGCGNLVAAFPGAHLVFTSSTSVYPQTGGEWVDESSPATPDRETGKLLRQAEDIVLGAGGTVLRLAGLYGPGRSAILKRFLEGQATIDGDPREAGEPGRTLNQVHRDDVVSALLTVISPAGAEGARHRIFNVSDDSPMSQRTCYTWLSKRFGLPLPRVEPPDPGRKRGWTDKRVSNNSLRRVGWSPRFPSFFDALDQDAELVPSILAQLDRDGG